MPHFVVALVQIVDDTQARIDRIEQRIRSLHVSDGVIGWEGTMTFEWQLCQLSFVC